MIYNKVHLQLSGRGHFGSVSSGKGWHGFSFCTVLAVRGHGHLCSVVVCRQSAATLYKKVPEWRSLHKAVWSEEWLKWKHFAQFTHIWSYKNTRNQHFLVRLCKYFLRMQIRFKFLHNRVVFAANFSQRVSTSQLLWIISFEFVISKFISHLHSQEVWTRL